MRIGTNISALVTHRYLTKAGKGQEKSTARLSSGIKITSAADNPAFYAIGNKLRVQSQGIAQANTNSANGVSMIQTAEGAFTEIHSMLQRVRELSVKAANDTNESEDKSKIQDEIDQLLSEINDTAYKTEYNKIKLLSGECDRVMKAYTSEVGGLTKTNLNILNISDTVPFGDLNFKVTDAAAQAEVTTEGGSEPPYVPGVLIINGLSIAIEGTDTAETVFAKVRGAADFLGLDAKSGKSETPPTAIKSISSKEYGSNQTITIGGTASLLEQLGFTSSFSNNSSTKSVLYQTSEGTAAPFKQDDVIIDGVVTSGAPITGTITINDVDIEIEAEDDTNDKIFEKIKAALVGSGLEITSGSPATPISSIKSNGTGLTIDGPTELLAALGMESPIISSTVAGKDAKLDSNSFGGVFTTGTTYKAEGNNVTITDTGGREVLLKLPADDSVNEYTITTSKGPLILQVGQTMGMELYMSIPKVSTETIGMDNISIMDSERAEDAVTQADRAISIVSSIRSKLGAYQNRLEHTISNLDNAQVDADASLSRIMDTDMASEMTDSAKFNVMYQAGIAILAQANQRPQAVLQLLQ